MNFSNVSLMQVVWFAWLTVTTLVILMIVAGAIMFHRMDE